METWWATLGSTFALVFLAELGDKTQLAVLGLSASRSQSWAVLVGSIAALTASTVIAFALGSFLKAKLDPRWIRYGAAVLFIVLGVVMLFTNVGSGGDPAAS